jgi:hypothetical protein
MLDEQNMGALMHEEASAPAPESTVDIGRALRVGRRRRRARLAASGSVAALTAVALIGGVAAVHMVARVGAPDQRLGSARTASPRPAAPAAFNPLVRSVDVGYLPTGLSERHLTINATSQQLSYLRWGSPDSTGARSADREIDVYVYTPGADQSQLWWLTKKPRAPAATPSRSAEAPSATKQSDAASQNSAAALPSGPTTISGSPTDPLTSPSPGTTTSPTDDPSQGEAGPPIGRGPSYWQDAVSGADGATLAWQWATNAWAFVRVTGYGPETSARPVAAKVAASVRTGLSETVAFPFTADRPPAQLALRESQIYSDGDGTFGASLSFSRDESMETTGALPEQLLLSSQTTPDRTGVDQKYADPNFSVNGHQAYLSFDGAGTGVIDIYGVSGQMLTLEVYDPVTARFVDLKQAIALAAAMAVVPGATDQANWTTSPLR